MTTIAFIIPLRNPDASHDWQKMSRLCLRTLGALTNQQSDDWHAILVCNESPKGADKIPNVTVIRSGFTVPGTDKEPRRKDKREKKMLGLEATKKINPQYVVALDADDLLHRSLVKFVGEHTYRPGWQIRHGYDWGGGLIARKRRGYFDQGCGSCSILNYEECKKSPSIFMTSHTELRHYQSKEGFLQSLPFYGAVHVLETGENLSQRRAMKPAPKVTGINSAIRTVTNLRYITPEFIRIFHLIPRDI